MVSDEKTWPDQQKRQWERQSQRQWHLLTSYNLRERKAFGKLSSSALVFSPMSLITMDRVAREAWKRNTSAGNWKMICLEITLWWRDSKARWRFCMWSLSPDGYLGKTKIYISGTLSFTHTDFILYSETILYQNTNVFEYLDGMDELNTSSFYGHHGAGLLPNICTCSPRWTNLWKALIVLKCSLYPNC